jgi:hypothetical protein
MGSGATLIAARDLKSDRNSESFAHDIASYLERYGRGKIPWDEMFPQVKHIESNIPNLSAYVVPTRQASLFGR